MVTKVQGFLLYLTTENKGQGFTRRVPGQLSVSYNFEKVKIEIAEYNPARGIQIQQIKDSHTLSFKGFNPKTISWHRGQEVPKGKCKRPDTWQKAK